MHDEDYTFSLKSNINNEKTGKAKYIIGAILVLLIICGVYIYSHNKERPIPTIKAQKNIKTVHVNKREIKVKNEDKAIYDDLFGDEKEAEVEEVIVRSNKLEEIEREINNEVRSYNALQHTIQSSLSSNKPTKNRLQLTALSSKEGVEKYWNQISGKYSKIFKDKKHYIEKTTLKSGNTLYKLQIGDFKSEKDAEKFCKIFIYQANKSKFDCIVVS